MGGHAGQHQTVTVKITLKQFVTVAVITASVLLGMQNASGLGHDFFTNYVLVVHFWTGGRVNLDQVRIPPNVKVNKGE